MFPDQEARKQKMRDEGRADIIDAHAHSAKHGEELKRSATAGCFYCCAVFPVTEIEDWITEPDGDLVEEPGDDSTVLCPKCGIDSVIGDASGFSATDKQFLKEMNGFWFS
jgi:hypothetical protein